MKTLALTFLLLAGTVLAQDRPLLPPVSGGGGVTTQQLADTAQAVRNQVSIDSSRLAPGYEGQTKSYPGSMTLTTGSLTASVGNISGAAGMVQGYTGLFDTLLIKAGTNMSKQPTSSITADGPQTNISISLAPKGTGAFYLGPKADGVAGRNARGNYAVDLQIPTSDPSGYASYVAEGQWSILGGRISRASGDYSIAFGYDNHAYGTLSSVFGGDGGSASGAGSTILSSSYSTTGAAATGSAVIAGVNNYADAPNSVVLGGLGGYSPWPNSVARGNRAWGLNQLIGPGRYQTVSVILSDSTREAVTDTLLLYLGIDSLQQNFTSLTNKSRYLNIDSGYAWAYRGLVVGRSDVGDVAAFEITGAIKRVGTTTSMVGSPTITTIAADAAASTWTATPVADDTHEALHILVKGSAGKLVRWHAEITFVQVGF